MPPGDPRRPRSAQYRSRSWGSEIRASRARSTSRAAAECSSTEQQSSTARSGGTAITPDSSHRWLGSISRRSRRNQVADKRGRYGRGTVRCTTSGSSSSNPHSHAAARWLTVPHGSHSAAACTRVMYWMGSAVYTCGSRRCHRPRATRALMVPAATPAARACCRVNAPPCSAACGGTMPASMHRNHDGSGYLNRVLWTIHRPVDNPSRTYLCDKKRTRRPERQNGQPKGEAYAGRRKRR